MIKTILAVLIAAVPAGAGEFTLDRQLAGTLPAVAVPAAPLPAAAATGEAKSVVPLPASFTDWRGKEMTCVSAYDPEGSVTVAFDQQWGILHRISLDGRPMWQYDGGVTDFRSIHLDGKDLIARTGFLQDLLKKAGLTAAYDSANLTLSAKGFYPTPEAALAKIGDDGSGIVYVDLLKGGRQAGTALFAGWGGIFNCRPAASRLERTAAADLLEVPVIEASAPQREKGASRLSVGEIQNRWIASIFVAGRNLGGIAASAQGVSPHAAPAGYAVSLSILADRTAAAAETMHYAQLDRRWHIVANEADRLDRVAADLREWAAQAKAHHNAAAIRAADLARAGEDLATALRWLRADAGLKAGPLTGERAGRSEFRSAGFYQGRQQAGLAMLAAVKVLKKAGADVVAAEVGAYWAGLYYFELAFVSEHALSSHTGAAYFSDEREARESLRQMAALLADGDRAIIAAELTRDDRGFSYAITALEGAAPAPDDED